MPQQVHAVWVTSGEKELYSMSGLILDEDETESQRRPARVQSGFNALVSLLTVSPCRIIRFQ